MKLINQLEACLIACVLAEQGVQLNAKTMRRYCQLVGVEGMKGSGVWCALDMVSLCKRMNLNMTKVQQVLDYTHAKQQLDKLLTYVSKCNRQKGKLDRKMERIALEGADKHIENGH